MTGPGTTSGPRVVLFSRQATLRRAADVAGVRCAAVESGYEAAAELLAAPALALIIDLPLLTPRHVRLLEIARHLSVEVLGLGLPNRHLEAASLSGIRLISPDDLTALLGRMGQAPQPPSQPVSAPAARTGIAAEPAAGPPAVYVPAKPAPSKPTSTRAQASQPTSELLGRYQGEAAAAPLAPDLTDEEFTALAAPAVPQAEEPAVYAEDTHVVAEQAPPPIAPARRVAAAAPADQGDGDGSGHEPAPPAMSPRDLLSPEELAALLEDQR